MRSIILSLTTTIIIIVINATFVPLVSSSSSAAAHHVQGDELILTNSNDGGGCWDDDECQAYPPAETGSGSDDLITPRIVVLNPRPSLAPVPGMRTSSISTVGSACMDDEDCNLYEGSGYDTTNTNTGSRANRGQYPYDRDDSSSPNYNVRPPYSPPSTAWDGDDKSILYTSKPIPPADPVTPWPIIPKPRPTAPRPTGPRVIVDVPKPVIPSRGSDSSGSSSSGSGSSSTSKKDKSGGSRSRTPSITSTSNTSIYNKSAADRTALVIGLVAAILILIVIVAPLIVFCKVRLRGAVGKGQLLTTTTAMTGDRTALYQPYVQPTVTTTQHHPMTPGGAPRLIPASMTSASLGHGLLSTTGQYGQVGGSVYGQIGGGAGIYGTIGGQQFQQQQQQQQPPGTLPKKKDNREWYV